MRINLHPEVSADAASKGAERVLRNCVQCGFCTAVCPTYLETGNELDGPRGRINLMRLMLEENSANATAIYHLDRCLTCRACETSCPSDVAYGELLQFTRERYELTERRSMWRRMVRLFWLRTLPVVWLGRLGFKFMQWLRPWLGGGFRRMTLSPVRVVRYKATPDQTAKGPTLILLPGCVQSYANPETLAAAEAVLSYLGADVRVAPASCCGAMDHHAGRAERARQRAEQNAEVWKHLTPGTPDAVVSLATGCSLQIREYEKWVPSVVRRNPKAIEEVISMFNLSRLPKITNTTQVAWQPPCTLTNGLKIDEERILVALRMAGYHLLPIADRHCCGSAGLYSLEQRQMANELRKTKLAALMASRPDVIATANVGCQLHLSMASEVPIRHWIELLAAPLISSDDS